MKKSIITVAIQVLALAGLLSLSYTVSVFALPHGRFYDLHTFAGVGDIWDLTCSLSGKIYGGTSGGYAGSQFFSYHWKTGALTIYAPNMGIEVYSLTTSTGSKGLVGEKIEERIYGGSYKADPTFYPPAHGAHFFTYNPNLAWNPGTINTNDPYIMGPWHRLVSPMLPDAAVPDEAIIMDLETGFNGKIYGGSGYAIDVGHDYTYLFEYDPLTQTMRSLYHFAPAANCYSIHDLTIGINGWIYFVATPSAPAVSHLWVYKAHLQVLPPVPTDLGTMPGGRSIGALTTGTDGRIYVGSLEDGAGVIELAYYDPNIPGWVPIGTTNLIRSVRTMTTGLKNMIYGGDYGGNFWHYEPQKGWNPGPFHDTLFPNANPAIRLAVTGQDRIRTLTTGLNGKAPYVYGGTGRVNAHLFSYFMYTPDINEDGIVNILDLVICAGQFGFDPPEQTQNTPTVVTAVGSTVAGILATTLIAFRLKTKTKKSKANCG